MKFHRANLVGLALLDPDVDVGETAVLHVLDTREPHRRVRPFESIRHRACELREHRRAAFDHAEHRCFALPGGGEDGGRKARDRHLVCIHCPGGKIAERVESELAQDALRQRRNPLVEIEAREHFAQRLPREIVAAPAVTDNVSPAARLFDLLHEAEQAKAPAIAVAPIPAEGLGLAINDRLARAAAPR